MSRVEYSSLKNLTAMTCARWRRNLAEPVGHFAVVKFSGGSIVSQEFQIIIRKLTQFLQVGRYIFFGWG